MRAVLLGAAYARVSPISSFADPRVFQACIIGGIYCALPADDAAARTARLCTSGWTILGTVCCVAMTDPSLNLQRSAECNEYSY